MRFTSGGFSIRTVAWQPRAATADREDLDVQFSDADR
jgi:hypothetical protein